METIRTSKFSRILACYLAIQLIVTTIQPSNLYALTGGPAQPEFNSFTPIGTSDMVNLSSGDFNYNIPIMDVGGYPINLAYNSGVTMDQEASWVGLGWDLSVGQINRQVRGLPDDFDGDPVTYENNIKDNITVGATLKLHPAAAGTDLGLNLLGFNLGIDYNNYQGFTFKPSIGLSYQMSENNSVDINLATSSTEGASISPSLSISEITKDKEGKIIGKDQKSSYGLSFNSRQGITGLTISNDITKSIRNATNYKVNDGHHKEANAFSSGGNTLSFGKSTFTPQKRTPYKNQNFGFNYALGTEVFFGEFQGEIYAYASTQKMLDKITTEKTYGYEHTEKATKDDVLDFNRENDRSIGENTTTLPIPNYTYDVYSINGQGIGGMFRPFRSQVGYVYDKYVQDKSDDLNFGVEIGSAALVHIAADFKYSPSTSSTGLWTSGNRARRNFREVTEGNEIDYEKVYFKSPQELNFDNEFDVLTNYLGGYEPIRLGIDGFMLDKKTIADKYYVGAGNTLTPTANFSNIKRNNRLLKKQTIQKLAVEDLNNLTETYTSENKPAINLSFAKPHHTAAVNILKEDGSRYIYNQPLYNIQKIESSFNVTGRSGQFDCVSGLVNYNAGSDNTTNNGNGKDEFYNKIITPAYVHTYLLSSVLSADYQDLKSDGPTDDDLGSYTKFTYGNEANYKWRLPFEYQKATLNEGLYSTDKDQTGSYTYGEKEIKYVRKIETKTHIAIFDISERKDAIGVEGQNGENSSILSTSKSKMKRLNRISLYSKPEYKKAIENGISPTPIKVAHFEYDYSLCKNVPNNDGSDYDSNGDGNDDKPNELGKLTLRKVYFTYRGSNMGKYTPYKFNYEKTFDLNNDDIVDRDNNPNYNIKGYNMWGNYKENFGGCKTMGETTNAEFPYVNQDSKLNEDINASAWSLISIDLPSGGTINLEYESDDYQYVQDKKALQMFKVTGVSVSGSLADKDNSQLYNSSDDIEYAFIKIRDGNLSISDFRDKYIGNLQDEVIYFRFLMSMIDNPGSKYDYVTGYFNLGNVEPIIYANPNTSEGGSYVAIPISTVRMEGGVDGNRQVNPFSKAGWGFARTYLNRMAYSQNGSEDNFTVGSVVDDIISQIRNITEIFKGPNKYLRDQKCAKLFIPAKSWIRLQNPDGKKMGGGVRIKKIEMSDEWNIMTGNVDNPVYNMTYGQEYNYNLLDGTSSGVATFEPDGTKENPFVKPFEDHDINHLLAPSDKNYVEGPLGSSFFPSPQITYSRVEVKNLERNQVNKHATGKVINEFYTSKDFPTIAKHTVIDNHYNEIGTGALASFFELNIYQDKHLAVSQGFVVETNDMNGKQKSQKVFPVGAMGDQDAISMVEYKYHVKSDGSLENKLFVYDEKGEVNERTLGVTYDVVNDFRTSESYLGSVGADINLALVPTLPPVVILFFGMISNVSLAFHRTTMRSSATTKVIYKSGILKEKIAYDLGSSVSTKNLVYEANTGEVLLTQTTNEYKENYYNFNYPAYWFYNGMGQASKNIDIKVDFDYHTNNHYRLSQLSGVENAGKYLVDGDEVSIEGVNNKIWVIDVGKNGVNSFDLMNADGQLLNDSDINIGSMKIMRSGYKNLQTASMASVTTMVNPLVNSLGVYQDINMNTLNSQGWQDYRIINTSAVEYSDIWPSQCECDLPKIIFNASGEIANGVINFNPYLKNVKGNWRAKKSYAYLTGRHNSIGDPSPRNSGFLIKHSPFYKYNGVAWIIDNPNPETTPNNRWTFASEVSEYSPYGTELENKDALARYSSAEYGFSYNFPLAVTSNSKYKEMGYDSFEDFETQCEDGHFNFKRHVAQYGGVELSTSEAHSGRKSIKIKPNNRAVIESRLVECDTL